MFELMSNGLPVFWNVISVLALAIYIADGVSSVFFGESFVGEDEEQP